MIKWLIRETTVACLKAPNAAFVQTCWAKRFNAFEPTVTRTWPESGTSCSRAISAQPLLSKRSLILRLLNMIAFKASEKALWSTQSPMRCLMGMGEGGFWGKTAGRDEAEHSFSTSGALPPIRLRPSWLAAPECYWFFIILLFNNFLSCWGYNYSVNHKLLNDYGALEENHFLMPICPP